MPTSRRAVWRAPRAAVLLAAIVLCSPAWGQTSGPASAPSRPVPATQPQPDKLTTPLWKHGQTNTGDLMWQMLGSVALILGLGLLCYVLVKRVLPRITSSGGKEVRVLETTPLGRTAMVHLLKVGTDRFLVASSRDSVSMLAKVTPSFGGEGEGSGKTAPEGNGKEA
ncbi:MAG TPA: flagellar biosynthetic protein FliO [Phycisphaerae bacterium]|nr:flagellar biosynthetic protein FliO [Phycisphaerae bacterium]